MQHEELIRNATTLHFLERAQQVTVTAEIELKGKVKVKPVFCKSRAVPFALRKQVEEILQQVEDGGVTASRAE